MEQEKVYKKQIIYLAKLETELHYKLSCYNKVLVKRKQQQDKHSINKCIQQVVEEIIGILTLVPAEYCTEALGV